MESPGNKSILPLKPMRLSRLTQWGQTNTLLGIVLKSRILIVSLVFFALSFSLAYAGDVVFETKLPWYYSWSDMRWGIGEFTYVTTVAIGYRPPTNQEVCTVKPGLYKSGNPTDTIILTVRGGSQGYPTSGSVIGTAALPGNQVANPPLLAQQSAYTTFSFSPCLNLTAGAHYSFVLSRTQPNSPDGYVSQLSNLIYYPQASFWAYVPVNGFWKEKTGYEPALRLEGPDAPALTPVLIIPGIAGSELYNGNDLIWADLGEMLFNLDDDQFLIDNLMLDGDGNSINQIEAKNVIEAVLQNIPILNINIFKSLRLKLEENKYVLNQDLFFFPYDWRLNLDNSKDLLKTKIDEIKAQTGAKKVHIIAHSMGGLLAKDYLNSYGKDSIDKLIFVGTPHLGAPKSARILLAGDNMGIPWLNQDRVKEVVSNSPAAYELLPNDSYFNNFQGYIQKSDSSDLLNYQDSKSFLLGNLNSNIMDMADSFWAKNLENTDFSGISTYNIAGCSTGTEAGYLFKPDNSSIAKIGRTSGDKTVPLVSSDSINIPASHKFYLKKANHAELPSQVDVRTAILNILSDKPASSSGDLKNDQSQCNFKGKELSWHSPVAVHIYDAQGRHTGPIENDGIENSIPGVDYQIIGHDKFVFLPTDTGETYTIVADGLATGSFDLLVSQNNNGVSGSTTVFNDVPIGTSGRVNLIVSDSSSDSTINVDYSGNGTTVQNVPASSVLSANESLDATPPGTQATVTGQAGTEGWYLSDVSIVLSATDDNSGILETKYSLDGQPLVSYSGPIHVSREGQHTILYYSIDKAGNNEEVKTPSFGIDTTGVEISVGFDLDSRSFKFGAVIDSPDNTYFSCNQASCTAQDQAGNTTQLKFSLMQDGSKQRLRFHSVATNGVESLIASTQFIVRFKDKDDAVKDFDQVLSVAGVER